MPLLTRRFAPQLIALAIYLSLGLLYAFGSKEVFDRILSVWGVNAYRFAFLDTDTILSAIRCFNMGVDAYTVNPCDDLGRVYTYSPIWTLLTVFPVTEAWIIPTGLLFCAAFVGTLFLFPRPRNATGAVLLALGFISGSAIYALERGNNDLVLFALVGCGAYLVGSRPKLKPVGYAFIFLAGLLKYFPLAVLSLAGREPVARALRIAATCAVAMAIFLALAWHDLPKAFANIPNGHYMHDWFGAPLLARGFADVLGFEDSAGLIGRIVMTLVALGIAFTMALERVTTEGLERLTEAERVFLFAGTCMICACYFSAQNIGYREIHLILALPGLIVLAQAGGAFRFKIATALTLWCLFTTAFHRVVLSGFLVAQGVMPASIAQFAIWFVEHSLWWVLITILLSILIGLVARFPVAQALMPRALAARFDGARVPESA